MIILLSIKCLVVLYRIVAYKEVYNEAIRGYNLVAFLVSNVNFFNYERG